jgi:hypothetical protein
VHGPDAKNSRRKLRAAARVKSRKTGEDLMNAQIRETVLGFGLALAAAAAYPQTGTDRAPVSVKVYYGHVVVGEEPLVTLPTERGLVWTLTTSGYQFSTAGIVVPKGGHKCSVVPNSQGQRVRCEKPPHASGTNYKYTVNVIDSASGKALPALDPIIFDH